MNTVTLNTYIFMLYRVNQAEYGLRIRVVAPQEYVNIDSTRRIQSAWNQTKVGTSPRVNPILQ